MKVFISHTQKDMALARKVASGLKASGFDVFDDTKILPGQNWAEEIAQALRECEAMVVLLTPDALASQWVEAEISYGLGQPSYGHRLIPVFVGSPDHRSTSQRRRTSTALDCWSS